MNRGLAEPDPAPRKAGGWDVRDQDAAELLRALLEELRRTREETTALLEEIVRKLEDIRLNI